MRKHNLISILAIVAIFLAFASYAHCALVGKVSLAEGRVDVLKAGRSNLTPVKTGDPVDVGDVYRVKSDGRAEIKFLDGGMIRIAPSSRVEIKDYSSDARKTNNIIRLSTGHVQVISGKTFVQKVSQFVEGNRFEVHTPNAVAGIRGSNMIVGFIRSMTSTIFVDGKGYQYNPSDSTKTQVNIVKGQISFVAGNAPPTPPRKATPAEASANIQAVTVTPKSSSGTGTTTSSTSTSTSTSSSGTSGSGDGSGGTSGGETTAGSGSGTSSGSADSGTTGTGGTTTTTDTGGTTGSMLTTASLGTEAAVLSTSTTTPTGTGTTTTPVTATGTIAGNETTTLPYIPPAEPTPTPTATTTSFSSNYSGQLFKTFSGTEQKGDARLEPNEYSYKYVKTGAGRLGYGQKENDSGAYENIITGSGQSVSREFVNSSTGTEYYPDGTYINHSNSPVIKISGRGAWSFDATTLSTLPAGYHLTYIQTYDSATVELNGTSTGVMASTEASWSTAYPFTIGGTFVPVDAGPAPNVFRARIDGTTLDGGAFSGFAGGIIGTSTGNAGGLFYAVAIDPTNRGFLLAGGYNGTFDGINNKWAASGSIVPTVMNQSLPITPASFTNHLDTGFFGGRIEGDFGGSGTIKAKGWGSTLSISGQPWGVYEMTLGISSVYFNPLSRTSFSASSSGWGEFGSYSDSGSVLQKNVGFWLINTTGGTVAVLSAAGGKLSSDTSGNFWTYTMMGNAFGKFAGSYTSVDPIWNGYSAGYWNKTQDFSFAGSIDRGSVTRFVARKYDSYTYNNGDSWYSSYVKDSQTGNTSAYSAANHTSTERNYKPEKNTPYSRYTEQTFNTSTTPPSLLSSTADDYPYDISTLPSLAPSGYSMHNSGTTYGFEGSVNSEMTGIMGGVGNLWAATQASPAPVYLAGDYNSYINDGKPYLVRGRINSYNPYLNNGTTAIGGSYSGFYTAIANQGNGAVEYGRLLFVYVNNGKAGIIGGKFTGNVYPYAEAWKGSGTIYPVEIASGIAITPENLFANIITKAYDNLNINSSGYTNSFSAGGTISLLNTDIRSIWIDGQQWGVIRTILGGTFSGTTSDSWEAGFEWGNTSGGGGVYELLGRAIKGTKWSGNRLEGDMGGFRGWISASDYGVNISTADIAGTFNATMLTWQAIGAGTWMSVNKFLEMQANSSGQDALTKLNIPCVQVGSATLTGSGNGFSSFTIGDAKFFSTTSGGNPMIWASNNVTGTYTSLPVTGGTTPLTGGGLTANVVMKQWDVVSNKWLAGVNNGTGNLSGGSYTGTVNFKGAAAGNIVPSTSTAGSISGVAGGIAKP